MKTTPIDVNKCMKDFTLNIKIKGMPRLKVRMTIGLWLIKLGCKVIGCKVKVEDES